MTQLHVTEEVIEQFSRGRLNEPALTAFEEHLLVCAHCQRQVARMDDFLAAFHQLARRPQYEARPSIWETVATGLRNLSTPVALPVAALAIVSLVLLVRISPTVSRSEYSREVHTARLTAMRGEEAPVEVKGGGVLELQLDARGLPTSAVDAEIANRMGSISWQGKGTANSGLVSIQLKDSLKPGLYWVRLYGDDRELLREYGLNVR